MKRYFAKKSNDDTKPFEIHEDDFDTSPLYQYEMVVWFIMGAKQSVSEKNILSVAGAEANMPGVGRLLPNFQYFRNEQKVDGKSKRVVRNT